MHLVANANSLAGLAKTKNFTVVDNCVLAVIRSEK